MGGFNSLSDPKPNPDFMQPINPNSNSKSKPLTLTLPITLNPNPQPCLLTPNPSHNSKHSL